LIARRLRIDPGSDRHHEEWLEITDSVAVDEPAADAATTDAH
jgi:hypothetical protein